MVSPKDGRLEHLSTNFHPLLVEHVQSTSPPGCRKMGRNRWAPRCGCQAWSLHVASVEHESARGMWCRAQKPAVASSERECSPSSTCLPPTRAACLMVLLPWQTARPWRNDSSRFGSWHRNITEKSSVFLNKAIFFFFAVGSDKNLISVEAKNIFEIRGTFLFHWCHSLLQWWGT